MDKLRWMRGSEPMPGYDALSVEEIVTALSAADSTTIKKVRSYERKFANRPSSSTRSSEFTIASAPIPRGLDATPRA